MGCKLGRKSLGSSSPTGSSPGTFPTSNFGGWAQSLQDWNLKLALEVGAIKPWGTTGQAAFDHERKNWDKYIAVGGKIDTIAMDEPLVCTRFFIHKPDDYAVQETANFIQLVRQQYPDMRIGDIEGYPTISYDDMTHWIDALQAKLKEMNVKGLDFFRIDTDWVHFIHNDQKGSWPQLKKLEMFCRARGVPFSLVYWAADYPALRKLGVANDSTWYTSIMQMGYDYRLVNGTPDEIVIESWVSAPSHTVPETDSWSFTRSVLDFCNTFVK